MGISLTENEARALRDAIRTDIAMREEEAESGNTEQAGIIGLLNEADNVLMSVYMYPDERMEYERVRNAPRYFRVTLDVPVYPAESDPDTWPWADLIGSGAHPVHVVMVSPIDDPEVRA